MSPMPYFQREEVRTPGEKKESATPSLSQQPSTCRLRRQLRLLQRHCMCQSAPLPRTQTHPGLVTIDHERRLSSPALHLPNFGPEIPHLLILVCYRLQCRSFKLHNMTRASDYLLHSTLNKCSRNTAETPVVLIIDPVWLSRDWTVSPQANPTAW